LIGDDKVTYNGVVGDDDRVFKALADGTRRFLLDELFARDGQTLSELESLVPMSRFGVMKHLGLLEESGLIVSRRFGREKRHYLNPVPIRLIHDRWIDKYTESWSAGLSELKQRLERSMEKVFEIYMRTTPERLWEAIVDPGIRSKYSFGMRPTSALRQGEHFEMGNGAGMILGEGDNLEVDPPRRLVQTMVALWSDEAKAEGTTRVTWEIEAVGDSCRLTVIHDQMREGADSQIYGGWPMIISGLKTWLETGELLTTPGSILYT
jgi:uncharacterized protein YndB with AHSA1/START domain